MLKISFPFSEISHTLHSPSGDVWDIITDTTRLPEWGPSIIALDCMDRFITKGTRGTVRIPIGIWVPFVITAFVNKRYWSWDIWGIHATGHKLEPLNECSCNIYFEVPTLVAPYLFVCWIAIKRIEAILQHAT